MCSATGKSRRPVATPPWSPGFTRRSDSSRWSGISWRRGPVQEPGTLATDGGPGTPEVADSAAVRPAGGSASVVVCIKSKQPKSKENQKGGHIRPVQNRFEFHTPPPRSSANHFCRRPTPRCLCHNEKATELNPHPVVCTLSDLLPQDFAFVQAHPF